MNIQPWSTLGRFHTLWLKMISMKGIAFATVLVGISSGVVDPAPGLAFIGAILGLREYTKVKMNGFIPNPSPNHSPNPAGEVVDAEGGEA